MAGAGQLEALWQTVVEGDFFHSASHERKHLGFQLFSILMPHLRFAHLFCALYSIHSNHAIAGTCTDDVAPLANETFSFSTIDTALPLVPFVPKITSQCVAEPARRSEQVPAVLSRQFLRSLVNTTASPSAVLHSVARRCADRLAAHVAGSKDPHLAIAASVALQRHGGIGFERLSKNKRTAKLLQARPRSDQTRLVSELYAGRYLLHIRQPVLQCAPRSCHTCSNAGLRRIETQLCTSLRGRGMWGLSSTTTQRSFATLSGPQLGGHPAVRDITAVRLLGCFRSGVRCRPGWRHYWQRYGGH